MAAANFAGHGGDRDRARALCEQGLALARAAGASTYVAKLLTSLAAFDRIDRDAGSARARLTEALSIEAADDPAVEAVARATLAYVSIDERDFSGAAEQLGSSASLFRTMEDRSRLATVLATLAYVRTELGEHGEAAASLHEALRLAADFDDPSLAGEVLLVAAYAARRRDPLRAAQWLGFAESVYARIGKEWEPTDTTLREGTLADLRLLLEGPTFADARAAGGRLTAAEAIALSG
jgi:tetratricopeptide (TPR) repeat protein